MKSKLILLLFVFHGSLFIDHWSLLYAQCWPTTTDSAITVAPGWYPYAAVDEQEQSVMVVYLAGAQIRVKKYSKYGCPMWGGNPAIALDTVQKAWLGYEGNQWGQVISDDSGGVIICWKDFRHSDIDQGAPVNDEVYVQRIDVNGTARYGPNGIRASGPHTDGRRIIGDMKTDYHNGFYIAYSGDSSSTKTVLKHFDNSSNFLWAQYFSSTGGIDLNATDIWGSSFVSTGGKRYKFDYNGNSVWPGGFAGNHPDHPNYDQGGAYSDNTGGLIGVACWYSDPNYVVTVNRVDSNGQYVFDGGINVGLGGYTGYTQADSGGIYVSWNDNTVLVQKVNKDGIIGFNSSGLSICDSCGNDGEIVSDNQNGLISIWLKNNTYDSLSLYAQRINNLGNRVWDSMGIKFHVSYNEFFEFPIISLYSDKRGGALYLWSELDGGLNIKLKQVSRNSILGEVDSTIGITEENPIIQKRSFHLYQNYPNPFNPNTTITYTLLQGSYIELKIYNIIGQELYTIVKGFQNFGNYKYNIDMSPYSSGVYIYRLKTQTGTQVHKMLYIK